MSDFINREALLDTLARNWETITDIDDYYFFVKEAPAADVVEVSKHRCTKRENGYSFYVKCTCGATFNIDSYYCNYFKLCPNCGAKMIGDEIE